MAEGQDGKKGQLDGPLKPARSAGPGDRLRPNLNPRVVVQPLDEAPADPPAPKPPVQNIGDSPSIAHADVRYASDGVGDVLQLAAPTETSLPTAPGAKVAREPSARPPAGAPPKPFSVQGAPRRRRARAIEAEADLWAALDSGPPSIPSAARVDRPAEPAAGEPAPSHPSGVTVGQILADRYEILSVLGEGGMGIVYRCRDTYAGDDVALKRVVKPEGPLANEYVMWFYKEARALATLDHPNVVRARDFGQLDDGSPFLVMDLASGVSLHDLAHTRMSFPLIWSIVTQILGALGHAHARGIIHGDLKPSNVLVEEVEGEPPRVHVLDFGLAWLKDDRHDERLDGSKAVEFAPHAGAGTPGYMAPEQIQHESHNVCGATDLYSVGCILYRMVSGKAPFSGESKELLRHHAFDAPPVPRLQIEAPPDVVHFVLRLLAKRPWDRWEFANEARIEWDRWRPKGDVPATVWIFPPLPRRKGESAPLPVPSARRGTQRRTKTASPVERTPGLLRIRQTPLVGRSEIRTKLQDICDAVVEGHGPNHRLAVLVGAAGVGKSRIAEWLCEQVHEDGSLVPLRARYRPSRGPLDGMMGAVTQYFNFERADRDTIERTLLARWKIGKNDKSGRTWVAAVAEWLRPLGPISDQPIGPSGIRFTLDTVETRRMVVRHVLRRIARGRPLLLWLDDLHHATASVVEGLVRLHEEEPDQRMVVLATFRSEEHTPESKSLERLAPLLQAISADTLEVRAMDTESTCQLLRAALPLDADAVEEAARRSRGNPLFALQQLHAWALAGEMIHEGGRYRVPPSVLAVRPRTTADLWDSRLSALPAEHRLAAYAAASLGSDIRRAVLRALLSSLEIPSDAAMLSLQRAEILSPRGPGRYIWSHALLLEHLAEQLHRREDARRILRSAAEALTRHPLAGTRRIVRQRVTNLLGAGDADAAAMLLFDFLQASGAPAREPLTLLSDLDLLKGKLQGRPLALKHRWQAEALRQIARNDEAAMHAEIARTAFLELGDHENLAHTLRLLGHIAAEQGHAREGLSLVEQARGVFEEQNGIVGLAQCEAVVAQIHFSLGETEIARSTVEQAQSHFASLGQPLGRGHCLLLLGNIEQAEGNVDRARRRIVEARGEFERAGHRLGIAQSDAALAHVEHRMGNYHNAERGALDALQAFETLSTPRHQLACERLLAMIGVDTDDAEFASLHVERFGHISRRVDDPAGIFEAHVLLGQVALMRFDPAEAGLQFAEARRLEVSEAPLRQHLLLAEAWLDLVLDRQDSAYRRVQAAMESPSGKERWSDHVPQLLARLCRYPWPEERRALLTGWLRMDHDRRRGRD